MKAILRKYPVHLAMGWAIMIGIIMLIPGNVIPKVPEWSDLLTWDKLVHITLFLILVILTANAFRRRQQFPPTRFNGFPLWALLLGIVFGGCLEILQAMLPIGRSGNIFDLIADSIGCVAGSVISQYMARRVS